MKKLITYIITVPLLSTSGLQDSHMSEFYDHAEYQRILREVGLDDESIVKLEFPPLPF